MSMSHVTDEMSRVTHMPCSQRGRRSSHQSHEWCKSRHVTYGMSHTTHRMSHVTHRLRHVTHEMSHDVAHMLPGQGFGASSHESHEWCESRLITQGMGHVTLKISHVAHGTPGEGCGASSHQLHEWCESRHVAHGMSHITHRMSHVTHRLRHVTRQKSHDVTHMISGHK